MGSPPGINSFSFSYSFSKATQVSRILPTR